MIGIHWTGEHVRRCKSGRICVLHETIRSVVRAPTIRPSTAGCRNGAVALRQTNCARLNHLKKGGIEYSTRRKVFTKGPWLCNVSGGKEGGFGIYR